MTNPPFPPQEPYPPRESYPPREPFPPGQGPGPQAPPRQSPGQFATQHATTQPVPIQQPAPPPQQAPPPQTSSAPQPAGSPRHSAPSQPAPDGQLAAPPQPDPKAAGFLLPLVVGSLVAVLLGVYGSLHEPTGFSVNISGFSSGAYAKAWLATVAVLLAVVQLVTARMMYSPAVSPGWVPGLHRWSGRIALLLTVPVVVHCLFALGFETYSTRVLVHSVMGCVVYGAFVAKMLSLSRPGVPGWALPLLGGLLFAALVAVWFTSAVWLFDAKGLHT